MMIGWQAISSKIFTLQISSDFLFTRVITFDSGYLTSRMHERLQSIIEYMETGLTSWLSFVVSTVSLSLSHWYPVSGVVLDCIDS